MPRQITLSLGLPLALALIAAAIPVALPAGYHAFADHSTVCGLHPFGDAASNLGFLAAGLFVWTRARAAHERLLALALAATCLGSWYYHLSPDDARLLVDRLPMAPAFAAMGAIAIFPDDARRAMSFALVASLAFAGAAWIALAFDNQSFWVAAQVYVLLLVLSAVADARMRAAALSAFGLYVAAKLCETLDHQTLAATGFVSGHTIKHLLAALAPALWFALWRRAPQPDASPIGGHGPAGVGSRP